LSKIILSIETILKFTPRANKEIADSLSKELPAILEQYKINTKLRVAHFLAQAAHESDNFKTLQGYADGSVFEGRKDLGNTHPGDGIKYKERGIFQLAGRYNYEKMAKSLKLPLDVNPELAATPHTSSLIAAKYWDDRKMNLLADEDDILSITKKINGGTNGIESRKKFLAKIMALIDTIVVSDDYVPPVPIVVKPEAAPVKPAVTVAVITPAKPVVKPVVVAPAKPVVVAPVVKPKPPVAPTIVSVKHNNRKGVVGININLRSKGSMEGDILRVLKKGSNVKMIETVGNWTKVMYVSKTEGEVTGWLFKSYVHAK